MKCSAVNKCHLLNFEPHVPFGQARNSIDHEHRQSLDNINETNKFEHIRVFCHETYSVASGNIVWIRVIKFKLIKNLY